MRIRVLGVGMGPQHVTPEVADALRSCDYVLAVEKREGDGLLAARRAIAAEHGVEVVAVPDPERDRADPVDYAKAVKSWHEARVAAYEQVLRERGGTAAFLVWGDPSLYDSTVRIVESILSRGGVSFEYDVVPGVSAVSLLAARHRIVLHRVGEPVVITTGRKLLASVAAGADNLVVMLDGDLTCASLDGSAWDIWWGANLGTGDEALVAGGLCDVLGEIRQARSRAKEARGWVMDTYLLRRRPTPSPSAPTRVRHRDRGPDPRLAR